MLAGTGLLPATETQRLAERRAEIRERPPTPRRPTGRSRCRQRRVLPASSRSVLKPPRRLSEQLQLAGRRRDPSDRAEK